MKETETRFGIDSVDGTIVNNINRWGYQINQNGLQETKNVVCKQVMKIGKSARHPSQI